MEISMMMHFHRAAVLLASLVTCIWVTVAAADSTVAWDEEVNGDLSNDFGSPTLFTISEPGEYVIRVTTGPMVPVRREGPAGGSGMGMGGGSMLELMDKNGDRRIQRDEAIYNFAIHFDTYDLNEDGVIELAEMGQFAMGGDGSDVFNFRQGPGINLVAIRLTDFDSGGPRNDGSVLAVIDHDESGEAFEAGGVEFTDDENITEVMMPGVAAIVMAEPDGGTEIYAEYDLWKSYRRNDGTVVWRIGEGQEKSTTELVFVFE